MDRSKILLSQIKTRYVYMCWILLCNSVHCELEVKITNGILKGQILQSRGGRDYYAYTGIPYARPPIGELRFKAPEPAEPWNGTLDATKEAKKCIQLSEPGGHEDCLYLNVYYPRVNKKYLPVMVWIHGGRFSEGHGWTSVEGPEFLMDKDLILISVNYRLGILGFISTEDDVIPGNYGLKDQVMALRWIRENIKKFNGNPDQVTIAGASSGGACVGYHMLSQMSKGLFHKAIFESGTPLCLWANSPPGLARKRAHTIATIAACNYDTSEDILKCLKRLPADYLIGLLPQLRAWRSTYSLVQFNPVVENCDNGQEAFLCHHPLYDFKQESFVPAIIGVNSAEGGVYVASLYNKTSIVYPELRTYFNRLLSIILNYYHYARPEDVDEIGERVLQEYFPSGSLDDETHSNAVNMLGDGGFIYCSVDMIKKLSSPVYNYFYDYQNEMSFNAYFGSCEKPLGVTHGDELTSIFALHRLSENDIGVSKLMVNIWYKFVSSETPTIDGTDGGTVWPKFTPNEKSYFLHIDSAQPKIIESPVEKSYVFWNDIFLNRFMTYKSSVTVKTEL